MIRMHAKPPSKRKYVGTKNSSECIQCIHICLVSFAFTASHLTTRSFVCSFPAILAILLIRSHVRLLISRVPYGFLNKRSNGIDLTQAHQHIET